MRPSPAEIARTLVAGHLPATLRMAFHPTTAEVRHATDCTGRPLLLARADEPLVAALARAEARTVVLQVDDIPPLPGAPSLGRVLVGGRVAPVAPEDLRPAVLEYAETHADADLFDVGAGAVLYQVDVREVRLVTSAGAAAVVAVDVDEYVAADPDPLHAMERELLADLAHHHAAHLRPYLARELAAQGVRLAPGTAPRPVRLDRYGLVVHPSSTVEDGCAALTTYGDAWVRVPFARPVDGHVDLAHLLHRVLFHPEDHARG